MPSFDNKDVLNISLAGPMRITDTMGCEVAIASVRSKQLLALLLRAGNMRKSRGALQALLWPDHTTDPASNLRQLVKQTRIRLKSHGWHLESLPGYLRLVNCKDLSHQKLDPHAEFFEDSPFGTEDYEDWLCIERSQYFDRPVLLQIPAPALKANSYPTVGLFNPNLPAMGSRAGVVTDWVSNLFRNVFTRSEFIEFFDNRTQPGPPCDLNIEISVIPVDDVFELSVAAMVDGRCHWSQSLLVPSGQALQAHRQSIQEFAQISVCATERCISQLKNYPNQSWQTAPLYEVVSRLFSLSPDAVKGGVGALSQMGDEGNVLAWRGFAKMVQNGERLVTDRSIVLSEAEHYILKALERAPADPSVLAIAAHYYAYVQRDFQRAYDLATDALKLAPFAPFVRDVCATLGIYTGNFKAAANHAEIACRLGRFGPMRHYFAGTAVMLGTLTGNHQLAIRTGSALLNVLPNFLPVMRHMSASLAAIGQVEQAHDLITDIQKIDPTFATKGMIDNAYAIPSARARQQIYSALQKNGLQR